MVDRLALFIADSYRQLQSSHLDSRLQALASSSLSNKVLYHQVVIAKRLQIERDLFCISLEDLSEQDDKALFISLGVDQIVSEMA